MFLTATTSASTEDLDGIAGYVVDVMDRLGAPGAGLLVALENVFPPLPSEVILPLAGFTASQGGFSLYSALFWTTLGSVAGAIMLYQIGATLGRERVRDLVARVPLLDVADVDKTEEWFRRHGTKAVFFGRMLPVFRSLISIPAGISQMHRMHFLALTCAGSLIWNSIFIMAGYWLGENWHKAEKYADMLQKLVIVVVVLATAWFIQHRLRRRGHDTALTA